MKKLYGITGLALITALTLTGCGNNETNKPPSPLKPPRLKPPTTTPTTNGNPAAQTPPATLKSDKDYATTTETKPKN